MRVAHRAPALLVALAALVFSASAVADDAEVAAARRRPPTWVQPVAAPQVEIVDHESRALPSFNHHGQRFVQGRTGQRYQIHITNPTASRMEVVVSVDGLDVVDGREANLEKRGYIVPAFGDVTIDGFRTSMDSVAAFRFGSVEDSYAARTGNASSVGVIGVAFFRERAPIAWRPSSRAAGGAGGAPPPSAAQSRKSAADDRSQGLGTRFGEERDSRVHETTFERAAGGPSELVRVRYDDREGLEAMGVLPNNRRFAQPPPPR
jgi:hypothetical protein